MKEFARSPRHHVNDPFSVAFETAAIGYAAQAMLPLGWRTARVRARALAKTRAGRAVRYHSGSLRFHYDQPRALACMLSVWGIEFDPLGVVGE